ncbi:DUF296 domain-containing protein [Anaerolineales bacterium]
MGHISQRADLHKALGKAAQYFGVRTGKIELLGGLHRVSFSAYNFEKQERLPSIVVEGANEIVGGHGTISELDGDLHIHLHLSIAYRDEKATSGIQVVGGHVAAAEVYAVEFIMTAYDGEGVHREEDALTGVKLWSLPTIEIMDS